MLTNTLSMDYKPGTNLKTQSIGANWLFLLPDLNLARTVFIGTPGLPSIKTVSQLSQEVLVCHTDSSGLDEIQALNLRNAHILPFKNICEQLDAESTDLIVLANETIARRFFREDRFQNYVYYLLKPEGQLYFEYREIGQKFYENTPSQFTSSRQNYWLTPTFGEMYTAVPEQDEPSIRYFKRKGFEHNSIPVRRFFRFGKTLNQAINSMKWARHYGTLMSKNASSGFSGPPDFLKQVAESSGVAIGNHRWFSKVGGGYITRKLVFFLFPPGTQNPDLIAKMVRHPSINFRLEIEGRALEQLQELQIPAVKGLPKVLFRGYHRDLAIVGESFIEGTPFKLVSDGSAHCVYLNSAIDFFTDLAVATSNVHKVTPKDVSKALSKLYNQFKGIYDLSPEHTRFLGEQIEMIKQTQALFPLVFQHGDPGIWNAIVISSHKAIFLDWESAEPNGIPLWDLFYLLHSYTTWVAHRKKIRNSLKGMKALLLQDTDINHLWVDTTRQYCDKIGLSEGLVEPLFYTCWMHRALKESTRLAPTKLNKGSYIKLLRFLLERKSSPYLSALFALSKTPFQSSLITKGLERYEI